MYCFTAVYVFLILKYGVIGRNNCGEGVFLPQPLAPHICGIRFPNLGNDKNL